MWSSRIKSITRLKQRTNKQKKTTNQTKKNSSAKLQVRTCNMKWSIEAAVVIGNTWQYTITPQTTVRPFFDECFIFCQDARVISSQMQKMGLHIQFSHFASHSIFPLEKTIRQIKEIHLKWSLLNAAKPVRWGVW